MGKGRRYDSEPKLNLKKVFAVVIAIIVIIMVIIMIKNIFTGADEKDSITSQTYFAVYDNNKWGVINSTGEFVIDPAYSEMIIVPDSKTDVFLCMYDVNYEEGTFSTKALNSKNLEVFTNYDQIEALSNVDENNNMWYESNVLKVQKDGKYGIINLTGKELTSIEYDSITPIMGIKNALKVEKDGKFGIINNQGTSIIPAEYADITNLDKDDKHGYIITADDGKYGVIDYSNKIILEAKYDSIEKIYGNNLYVVTENKTTKVVDKSAQDVITSGFDKIISISKTTGQDAGVVFEKSGKYGFMNTNQETLIPATYDKLVETKSGIFIAQKSGKTGIIDIDEQEKLPFESESITYNEEADIYVADDENYNSNILDNNFEVKLSGILIDINTDKDYIEMRMGDQYKYYNFKFEEKNQADIYPNNTLFLDKQDGKYGFVDKNGKVVVSYIYDDAKQQNLCGYVAVKKDGKWGSIDRKGNVVVEPKYDLEQYLDIDFVGKWHKGLDLNMNYYSQE